MINEINKINIKRIHAVKHTKKYLKHNIREGNKAVIDAIKNGIVVFGYEQFIKVIQDVTG